MVRWTLDDPAGPFEVSLRPAESPVVRVLFAVGGGGDPERHGPLLDALAAAGADVVAPHAERLTGPSPSPDELTRRATRLVHALDAVRAARGPERVLVGIGHSIGGMLLLALAGARPWSRGGEPLGLPRVPELARLALLAPAVDWYAAPGALDELSVRSDALLAWVGSADEITRAADVERILAEVGEVRVVPGAGHFSFMHAPPPGRAEPLADRDAFLAALTREVCEAALGRRTTQLGGVSARKVLSAAFTAAGSSTLDE